MNEVSVTKLRRNLPGYLAMVQRGERISVISRGKVIAELALPSSARDVVAAARARLRGSVRGYELPFEPVIDASEWDMNR